MPTDSSSLQSAEFLVAPAKVEFDTFNSLQAAEKTGALYQGATLVAHD
jgi:hypothetical protein